MAHKYTSYRCLVTLKSLFRLACILSILYLVISRRSLGFYLFTSSRARRMYELFQESSPDKPCADAEIFPSMLENRSHLFSATRPWWGGWFGLISHYR